jgi:hypothetical protein
MTSQLPLEDYRDAAERCLVDGDTLHQRQRYANACHLFGLGAECALKALHQGHPGRVSVPHRHLPELREDVLRLCAGKQHNGVRQLLSLSDYMQDWDIANRYWATQCFDAGMSARQRDHCRRTLYATGVRVGV